MPRMFSLWRSLKIAYEVLYLIGMWSKRQLYQCVILGTCVATLTLYTVMCKLPLFSMSHSSRLGSKLSDASSTNLELVNVSRLPQCLVIGVKKAGTRALLTFLDLHPDIVTSNSEVHFFDMFYEKGLSFYQSQMPPSSENQVTIEKTASYFTAPGVPERIKQMNNSIRLLLIVRNPVTVLVSRYTHWSSRKINPPSLEALLCTKEGKLNRTFMWLHQVNYHVHVARWLEHFRREQLHIVDGDQLVQEPHRELWRVEEFLGLDHFISEDMFYFNKTKGFYCMMISNNKRTCLGERKGRRHPTVKPEVLKELYQYYAPLNELFFNIVNKRFNWYEIE